MLFLLLGWNILDDVFQGCDLGFNGLIIRYHVNARPLCDEWCQIDFRAEYARCLATIFNHFLLTLLQSYHYLLFRLRRCSSLMSDWYGVAWRMFTRTIIAGGWRLDQVISNEFVYMFVDFFLVAMRYSIVLIYTGDLSLRRIFCS